MRRKSFDALLAAAGLVVAIVLAIAGGLLLWGHDFATNNVHDQLAQQQVYFPTAAQIKQTNDPEITKYVMPYAGQQVLTGQQAEVYANHYIAVHLRGVADGQTYSQVSEKFLTMDPNSPDYQTVAGQRQTLFMGETLRGLLLDAYAFGKVGEIAGIAAWFAFAGSGALLLLSGLGLWHLRRVAPETEVFPGLGRRQTPAPISS
jgi:hypothetical protein